MVHSGTSLGAVKAGLSQGPPEGLCIGFVFMMHGLFTICVLISVKQTCNACDLINCFDFVLNAPLRTCLKIFLSGAKKRNACCCFLMRSLLTLLTWLCLLLTVLCPEGAGIAQLVESDCTMLTLVRVHCAAMDFSARINLQCRFTLSRCSYSHRARSHASLSVPTLKTSNTGSRTIV